VEPYLNSSERHVEFYTALVEAHRGELLGFARTRIKNYEDAEDALEEALLIAWRRIDVLMIAPKPVGWLYNVLKNCIMKHFDSKKAEQRAIDAMTLEAVSDEDTYGTYDTYDIDGSRGIADLLTEDDLHIIRLKEQGYTHREIADMLGVPYGTVSSKVSRIKAKIQNLPDE
jgi:RNA polymerase sigma-70 factor (ECF subfamily)